MTSPELVPLLYAALAVAAIALLLSLLAWLRVRGYATRLRGLEERVEQSLEYYQGLSAGAVGQGQHLVKMEQDLARMRTRLDQLAAGGGDGGGNGAGFNQAIRMARKGCSAREIMETCGLSQVEADLVVLLHKEGQR